VICILAVLSVSIVFQLKNIVILPSFHELENDEAKKNIERCIDAIKREAHHLDKLASDWSVWDDTYKFAKTGNRDFIHSNLQMETLDRKSVV
jgi:sensor domain CHASE-containing protein